MAATQTDRQVIDSMLRGYQRFLGWTAVGLSTIAACFWAFWGCIENFHEGWWAVSIWANLGLMLVQYLLPMLLFIGAALTAICWPRIGGLLHIVAGLMAVGFFRGAAPWVLSPFIVGPLAVMGIFYWFGRACPRRWAVACIASLPLLTAIVCGVEPAYRVLGRVDDGDRSARHVEGNGVDLIWAPEGPGWPGEGVSWDEAARRCRYLSDDGLYLKSSPREIWRLPSVEEAVRSMAHHGKNCVGSWDGVQVSYQRTPDKESPLWDTHSQVIYWWTATELNEKEAYIIVYDGKVWPRPKRAHWGYLAFRAVKASRS